MKKIKFKYFFFQYFKFSSRFMLFPTLQNKIGAKQIIRGGGGGGGVCGFFFLEKQFFLISRYMLFSTLKKIYIEKCPFTYWLNGRWFLQIVDRDSGNLWN